MKVSRTVGLVLVFLLLVASVTVAGQLRKPGIDGAAFLKVGVGARMVALGSAATTIYGDPNQIFWNPAGIQTDAGKTLVGLNYNDWLIDIQHTAAAVTHGFGDLGSFGLGVIYMGLSDIAADRDLAPPGYEQPVPETPGVGQYDSYNYYDLAVVLGYSKQFTDRFRMGLSAKYVRESIDGVAANAWAVDFGAVYETGFRDLTFGARINNVGSDLKFYAIPASLPLNFSVGASMSVAKEENTALKAFVDLTKPKDSPQLYFIGGEWTIFDKLALRGGYKFNYSGIQDKLTRLKQTDEGASFGAGLALPISGVNLWLDYAFTDFSVFENTHRFSLRFQF